VNIYLIIILRRIEYHGKLIDLRKVATTFIKEDRRW
jgi:hypothetical protein